MKTLKKIILLFVLIFIYTYIVSVDNIPQNIEIFKGEKINISTLWGISIKKENSSVETSSALGTETFENAGKETLEVNLFEKITLKTINVSVLEEVDVIPIGQVVGVKLYTSGVLVVGTSSIENQTGEIVKPFEGTGIREGDSIIEIDGKIINNTEELTEAVKNSKGEEIEITYVRNDKKKLAK